LRDSSGSLLKIQGISTGEEHVEVKQRWRSDQTFEIERNSKIYIRLVESKEYSQKTQRRELRTVIMTGKQGKRSNGPRFRIKYGMTW
jgi:hypothetical protein